jgi:hypothetical protein
MRAVVANQPRRVCLHRPSRLGCAMQGCLDRSVVRRSLAVRLASIVAETTNQKNPNLPSPQNYSPEPMKSFRFYEMEDEVCLKVCYPDDLAKIGEHYMLHSRCELVESSLCYHFDQ